MGASLAHSGSSGAGALADIRGFYIHRMYGLGLLFNFTHAFSIPSERGIMCIFCSNNSHALNLLPKVGIPLLASDASQEPSFLPLI